MKQLVEAGLVTREQRGKWAFFTVVDTTLSTLSDALRPSSHGLAGPARKDVGP